MARPKVFVTRGVFDGAISVLREHVEVDGNPSDDILTPEELRKRAREADGVLCLLTDRIDNDFLKGCPSLKIVSNLAVGYNNIDVPACTARGILVTNTPGVLTETTADFAWCLLLAVARRVVEADRFVRDGRFVAWGPRTLLGHDVHGKTLGIIGMGRIGQAVARRASGFGMDVVFYDPVSIPASVVDAMGVRQAPLEDVCREADFISVHVPLSSSTRHLLNERTLAMMKETCIVINTARGPVVDEAALVDALGSGQIAGAGLDVYEREPDIDPGLLNSDRVVLAPHIASGSYETRRKMCMMAVENLTTGLAGRRPPNLVNVDAWEPRTA